MSVCIFQVYHSIKKGKSYKMLVIYIYLGLFVKNSILKCDINKYIIYYLLL